MKKIFTLITCTILVSSIASAQLLLSDDFNYSGLLTNNGWTQTVSADNSDPIQTTTPGLTYPGYQGSGVGNAANLTGVGQDVNRGFAKQTANGANIWLSVLVNVTESTNISGNGVNFLHLGDRSDTDPTNFANFAGRIYVKANANGVSFGTSQTSSSAYGTTIFQRNTTYLLVLKYTINTAGTDDLSLWVFSSGVPATEADLGTPELFNPGAGLDEIDAVGLRQAAGLPDIIVDGLRISNSYQQISLPLNLTSFKASLTENSVHLNWTSANEQNVQGYEVERSSNGSSFTSIGNVGATNNSRSNYAFTDIAPLAGMTYYRLKMIDKDGVAKYSAVQLINNRKSVTVQVFPNPTFNNLNVSHPKAGKATLINIINSDGKQVKTIAVESGALQTNISVADLLKGSYMLLFESDGSKSITKFVKQ